MLKNYRFITTCKAHRSSHVYNGKTLISSTQVRGYNAQFLLYPQALTWWN